MLSYAKAIGANTDVVTAQAFIFPRETHPDQLLVILIAGVGDDAFTTIRKVGLEAENIFFEQEGRAESFDKICSFIKGELTFLEQFSAVISFLEKETLYIENINEFTVLLHRQNHTNELTRGLESEKMISGMLQMGDKVLFLSPPLLESEQNEWRKVLESNLIRASLENLDYELETFLQQLPKSDPVAVVAVELPSDVLESEQPPEEHENKDSSSVIDEQKEPMSTSGEHKTNLLSRLKLILNLPKISFRPHSKKKLLLVLGIMIVGLLIGTNLIFSQLKKNADFDSKLKQAQKYYDQALTIKDSDPNQSKKLLVQAKTSLNEAELVKVGDGRVKQLGQKINEGRFLILKQFEQQDFPVFLDLNLIKDKFSASHLSLSLGRMALLDSNTKSLVAIDITQKNPQILAGPLQLGEVQFTSLNGDYVYVYSKDKGILKVDAGNGKTTLEVKPDSEWQRIVDIFGFANNVYLLDEFKNQIWKYIATDKGFSDRNKYLRDGEQVDFAAVRQLQIDGAIWVLKSDNTVLKFVQGAKDFFQLKEFDPPLDKIKSFFVSDETDNIYFLDNENSRVVVVNKKGEYVSQYTGEKFKTAADLVVDEKGKKLYLLEGGKIYQIDLK